MIYKSSKQVMLDETSHYVSNHPGCDDVLLGEELLLVQRITVPSSGGYSSLGIICNTSVGASDVIHGSC